MVLTFEEVLELMERKNRNEQLTEQDIKNLLETALLFHTISEDVSKRISETK